MTLRGAAALAAALTCACAVDEAADVAAYREVLDGGAPAEAPPAPGEALDVRRAMRLANARDEALAARGEEYVRALIDRRRAAAAFLPTLALSPVFFARERTSSGSNARGVDVPLDVDAAVAPWRDAPELTRADRAAEERRALLRAAQDDLLLEVGRVHFGTILAERRAAVLRTSLATQEARTEEARARTQAGLARPLDVALSAARAADARARLVDAETDAANGRTTLAFLTAWALGDAPLDDAFDVPAEDPPSADAAAVAALARRPEVAAAARAVDAASSAVESAYGGYWPSVSLNLSAFLARDSDPEALDWTSVLGVRIPFFEAGLVEAEIRDALSRLREARLFDARVRRAVARDVAVARASFVAVGRRVAALDVRLDAARRAFDLAEGQWRAGLATNLERLTAQDELLAVELELAGAALERRIRWLELRRAEGLVRAEAGLPPEPEDRARPR